MNFNQELKAKASRGKALSYLIDEARGKCGPLFLRAESPDLRRIKFAAHKERQPVKAALSFWLNYWTWPRENVAES